MATFESEFLDYYLRLGLGSMPKSDIDALVMSLIDKYGLNGSSSLKPLSNQIVSERLKTPVAKIKKLRYEAALKFGGKVEEEAQIRLLAALSNASLESDGKKVCIIIEDTLAKSWLQGQLKIHQQIFDHPFNTEVIRVSGEGLFSVLASIFDPEQTEIFKSSYCKIQKEVDQTTRMKLFKGAAVNFAEGAASAIGASVVVALKLQLGIT